MDERKGGRGAVGEARWTREEADEVRAADKEVRRMGGGEWVRRTRGRRIGAADEVRVADKKGRRMGEADEARWTREEADKEVLRMGEADEVSREADKEGGEWVRWTR